MGNIKIDLIILCNIFYYPHQFIETYFDYDFCKNWYDGSVYRVMNIQSIVRQTCNLSKFHNILVPIFDKEKHVNYEQAIIQNDQTYPDLLFIFQRLNKYRERGFTIHIMPNFTIQSAPIIQSNNHLSNRPITTSGLCVEAFYYLPSVTIQGILTHNEGSIIKYFMIFDYEMINESKKIRFDKQTKMINMNVDTFLSQPNQNQKYNIYVKVYSMMLGRRTNYYLHAVQIEECGKE